MTPAERARELLREHDLCGVFVGSDDRFLNEYGYEKGEVKQLRLLPGGKIRAVLEVASDVEIYKEKSDVRVTPFSPLGGRVVEMKDLDEFVSGLRFQEAPVTEVWTRPLWHTPLVFVVALCFLIGEWAVRRLRGMP